MERIKEKRYICPAYLQLLEAILRKFRVLKKRYCVINKNLDIMRFKENLKKLFQICIRTNFSIFGFISVLL